ncbi:hypothetical protein T492DRAFT_848513 [Pavlovales sp. CCMP2436]|nr:hypothetical protein T492DRAFT_848513 [Pavlovales sp. CCMP2436]
MNLILIRQEQKKKGTEKKKAAALNRFERKIAAKKKENEKKAVTNARLSESSRVVESGSAKMSTAQAQASISLPVETAAFSMGNFPHLPLAACKVRRSLLGFCTYDTSEMLAVLGQLQSAVRTRPTHLPFSQAGEITMLEPNPMTPELLKVHTVALPGAPPSAPTYLQTAAVVGEASPVAAADNGKATGKVHAHPPSGPPK